MSRLFRFLVPRRLREYAQRCTQSGFIPRRSKSLQFVAWYIARFWLFIQVGRLRIVGAENLNAHGRLIHCANHSSYLDAHVIFCTLRKQPRYMTAVEEMRGMGGLKAMIMGALGSFPVDRGRGQSVVDPAAETLVNGDNLFIMPEGRISNSGEYLQFKSGSARIAIKACDRLNHRVPVAIVPMHICFGRRHEPTAGGPFWRMGLKWRGGVTVTVMKPIYIHNIEPLTPRNVTQVVRAAITRQACTTSHEGA